MPILTEVDYEKCDVFGGICSEDEQCWFQTYLNILLQFNETHTISGLTREKAEKLEKQVAQLGCQCLPIIQQIIATGKFHKK